MKTDRPYSRFAVSVNRKIGTAVERNYIKRRLKEIFRNHVNMLGPGYDLWIVMKKKFTPADSYQIEKMVVDLMIQLNYK